MIKKIINIAKAAGGIHMKYYKQGSKVELKNQDKYDMLTNADTESDKFITAELRRLFPKDLILSEENDDIPNDYSTRVWMVDPLDGTKEFVAGNGAFCSMIGLCDNGIPLLGVVFAPARNELYWAIKGKGAFATVNDKKIKLKCSLLNDLSKSKLISRNPHGEIRPLDFLIDKFKVKEVIPEGSVGLKITRIARGEAEFHINTNFRCGKWDTCAPQVILEEAGGILTDLYGKKLDYKQKSLKWKESFIGSNGFLHDDVISGVKNLQAE